MQVMCVDDGLAAADIYFSSCVVRQSWIECFALWFSHGLTSMIPDPSLGRQRCHVSATAIGGGHAQQAGSSAYCATLGAHYVGGRDITT